MMGPLLQKATKLGGPENPTRVFGRDEIWPAPQLEPDHHDRQPKIHRNLTQMLHVGNIYLHFPLNVAIFHQM